MEAPWCKNSRRKYIRQLKIAGVVVDDDKNDCKEVSELVSKSLLLFLHPSFKLLAP